MCSAPDVPPPPAERQPTKLPDQGSPATTDDYLKFRRAVMAGIVTSPSGTLGSPTVSKPTAG